MLRPLAALGERALDGGKATFKFHIGPAQGHLRIDLEMTREIDDRKQQVADLGTGARCIACRDLLCDFIGLFPYLREYRERIVPIEANVAGLCLQL